MELDPYHVKKVVSAILLPQNTAVAFALAGAVLCLWRWKVRAGVCLMLFGGFYYVVACMPITGFLLYRSLENRTLGRPDPATLVRNGVRHVVVMGAVQDGVAIWQQIPGATLILSSGGHTHTMLDQARHLGVPEDAIVLETKGRDTAEQAQAIKAMLGQEPFVLSTWSLHMWRALKTFRAEGLDPIPAPNHPVPPPRSLREAITPCHNGCFMTTVAIHEYVGTLVLFLNTLFGG